MDESRLMRNGHDPVSGISLYLPAGLIFQPGADISRHGKKMERYPVISRTFLILLLYSNLRTVLISR